MCENESFPRLLEELKQGDQRAIEEILDRIEAKIRSRARRRLNGLGVRGVESDDILAEVAASLWKGAIKGRFTRLNSKDDLFQVVYMLVHQKVVDWRRRRLPERTESAMGKGDSDAPDARGLGNVGGESVPPDITADFEERVAIFFDSLDDEEHSMALYHMEGLTNEKIAGKMNCSKRSVERKLPIVKKRLLKLFSPVDESASGSSH